MAAATGYRVPEPTMRFIAVVAVSWWCLAVPSTAGGQEGHPLKGSWLGTWAGNTSHSADVVIVLNWDGKSITGTINPGTDNMSVKNARLDPDGWVVHLEADAKDKSGRALTYIIDGKIENLHLPTRTIVGTWKNQKEGGEFRIARQ
jgi:hypothetical protein